MKPRLKKVFGSWAQWLCVGCGFAAYGITLTDAYCRWDKYKRKNDQPFKIHSRLTHP